MLTVPHGSGAHLPSTQLSPCVHAEPSSQAPDHAVCVQLPDQNSHSSSVHGFPSPQSFFGYVHASATGSHASIVHGSLSLHEYGYHFLPSSGVMNRSTLLTPDGPTSSTW